MPDFSKIYKQQTRQAVLDRELYAHVSALLENLQKKKNNTLESFADLELAKKRAANIRWRTFEMLDSYLIAFESNFLKRGAKVLWARNAEDIFSQINPVLAKHDITQVMACAPLLQADLNLYDGFEKNGINVHCSEPGEAFMKKAKSKPVHPVFHNLHLSPDKIFNQENTSEDDVDFALGHSASIAEANFFCADPAAIILSDTFGANAQAASKCNVQFVLCPVERLVPKLHDMFFLLEMQAAYAHGVHMQNSHNLIYQPRSIHENGGPLELYIILFDNNIAKVLECDDQRQALSCIRCGACHNVCPVYQASGPATAEGSYSGPIGAVIKPLIKGLKEHSYYSKASTLCKRCDEVCPVNIPLQKLLLYNRRDAQLRYKSAGIAEKTPFFLWKKIMLKREALNNSKSKTRKQLLQAVLARTMGMEFKNRKVAGKSFNEIWREKYAVAND